METVQVNNMKSLERKITKIPAFTTVRVHFGCCLQISKKKKKLPNKPPPDNPHMLLFSTLAVTTVYRRRSRYFSTKIAHTCEEMRNE